VRKNRSPWIHQLDKSREHVSLTRDITTDVAIVGAGIAGIATAFFALKHTKHKVVMLESHKLAHGATGHNAGQVASYFEKGFDGLVKDFGLELATKGQHAIDHAWELLEEMYTDAKLDIFFSRTMGHDGFSTYEQIVGALEELWLKRSCGLEPELMAIATDAPFIDTIPKKYAGLYRAMSHRHILEMLETDNKLFVAVLSQKRGCINSALFCERMLEYLLNKYPTRFVLYEHTPVHKVILHHSSAVIDAERHTVVAWRVILCTNGFENLHIINENGLEVDAKFHHLLRGRIAYMSAYLEPAGKPPVATSYKTPLEPTENLPYYYLTRRPYEYEEGQQHNLISIGGPEEPFEQDVYSRESEYPERAVEIIDNFIRSIYDPHGERPQYEFTWHGLMGYTSTGVRMVGPEPQNKVLLYNLGCNGVGILPSVMGGRVIARHLAGEKVAPSIFDIPKRITSPLSGKNKYLQVP
jgi:glycine/D-amino acid oxidase-like deaminating enzyme